MDQWFNLRTSPLTYYHSLFRDNKIWSRGDIVAWSPTWCRAFAVYFPGREPAPYCRAQVPTADASGSRCQLSRWERSAKPTHDWRVLQASLLWVMAAIWKPMAPFLLVWSPLPSAAALGAPLDGEAEGEGAAWTTGQRAISQSSGTGCNEPYRVKPRATWSRSQKATLWSRMGSGRSQRWYPK